MTETPKVVSRDVTGLYGRRGVVRHAVAAMRRFDEEMIDEGVRAMAG